MRRPSGSSPVVDNGSPHRGQVEIFFSIIQCKVLSPNDFDDLAAVEKRLATFEGRYNATAVPFKWRYTTTDLHRHLERLDDHDHDRTQRAA